MTKTEMIQTLVLDFKLHNLGENRATLMHLHQMLSGLDDASLSVLVAQATKQKLETLAHERANNENTKRL